MNPYALFLALLASLTPLRLSANGWIEKAPLVLLQGEQRLLEVPHMIRFSLGSSAVRAIAPPASTHSISGTKKTLLLLKGITPGQSDLWIWKDDQITEHRSIRVHRLKAIKHIPELEKSLQKLEEVEVILTGPNVLLQGRVQTLNEATIIEHLVRQFPKKIHNQTQVAPGLVMETQKILQQWLEESSYKEKLRLEIEKNSLWLKGTLPDPTTAEWIKKEMKILCPWIQFDLHTLPDQTPTVYFKVFLLELRRQQASQLGVRWPTSLSSSIQLLNEIPISISSLDFTLQQMESTGDAKILSHPELVVRAPGEAELFSGGQLPLATQNRYFSNVIWKSYGLTLRLKITHIAGNQIRLEILTEMSHLDPHTSQNTIPGIQSNRMKTQIDAELGVPLFLSGLLQQGVQEELKGLPILSKIPILGALFRSQDFIHRRSELVAILFPYTKPPQFSMKKLPFQVPRGPVPPPKQWLNPDLERQLRASKDFPWNVLD